MRLWYTVCTLRAVHAVRALRFPGQVDWGGAGKACVIFFVDRQFLFPYSDFRAGSAVHDIYDKFRPTLEAVNLPALPRVGLFISSRRNIMSKGYAVIGSVYVVEDTSRGLCKIGRTCVKDKPEYDRALMVKKSSGVASGRVYNSPLVRDAVKLEGDMHKIYKDKRTAGEWFKVSYDDVVSTLESRLDVVDSDYIKEMKAIQDEEGERCLEAMKRFVLGDLPKTVVPELHKPVETVFDSIFVPVIPHDVYERAWIRTEDLSPKTVSGDILVDLYGLYKDHVYAVAEYIAQDNTFVVTSGCGGCYYVNEADITYWIPIEDPVFGKNASLPKQPLSVFIGSLIDILKDDGMSADDVRVGAYEYTKYLLKTEELSDSIRVGLDQLVSSRFKC